MKKNIPMFITKDVPLEPVVRKAIETKSEIFIVKNQQLMLKVMLKHLEDK